MAQQNKKRKHEQVVPPSSQPISTSTNGGLDQMMQDDDSIDAVLFTEMSTVNDHLISLSKKVKLVGHSYFLNNSSMIDEFVSNIHVFLNELDVHRKKVSSDQLNSDNLFHIYQFLEVPELMNSCQFVNKMWRETLQKVPLKVQFSAPSISKKTSKLKKEEITSLLNGPYIKNVTSLSLFSAGVDTFQTLSTCKKLDNLTKLDLSTNNMGIQSVKNLKKCSMKNLTNLKLANVKKFSEKEAKELLNSSFMESIKQLDISNTDFSKENQFLQSISESKYLNQLTHLELRQGSQSGDTDYGLAAFLKDKNNLEYLGVRNHRLSLYPNLLDNGNFTSITSLDLSYVYMSNRDFVNLIVSPNLPKLTKLKAEDFNWGNGNIFGGHFCSSENVETVQCPPNSQASSLTDLDLKNCYISTFPSLTYHCPNLKRLVISNSSSRYCEKMELLKSTYETFLSAPTLSQLEYLDISDLACMESLFEIIFTSPFYSNLKELICTCCNMNGIKMKEELIVNCTNLINLRKISGYSVKASRNCLLALQNNPIFKNSLKSVSFNEFDEKFQDLMSYWERND